MPTENRSSNTEMVSVPRYLAEEINAALINHGHVVLPRGLQEAMNAQAEHHQGDPVAWMFKVRVHATGLGLVWREKIEQYAPDTEMVEVRDLVPLYSRPAHGDPVAWVSPVQLSPVNAQYDLGFADGCDESKRLNDQADAGEVEQMRAALAEMTTYRDNAANHMRRIRAEATAFEKERDTMRAHLAERDALLREWFELSKRGIGSQELHAKTETALSASVEPSAPKCTYCGDTGQIMVGRSGDANDGNEPIMESCEDCEPVRGSGSLEFDKLLAEYHAIMWASGEDGDLASIDTAKKLQALHRAALERKPS